MNPAARVRNSEFLPYLENMDRVQGLLSGLPHASSARNPRPMENWSLEDLREMVERGGSAIRKDIPNAMCFSVWSNKQLRVPLDKGLQLSMQQLWWLVLPGDVALISDGATHHYTSIGRVDRADGTITFQDAWPEDFFLQAGRNIEGIASIDQTITRLEFERVLVGILTWDTTELMERFFCAFPDARKDAGTQFRAGNAIMAVGPEYLAQYAVEHFRSAAQLAIEQENAALSLTAKAKMWLAAICARSAAIRSSDQRLIGALENAMREALAGTREDALLHELPPPDLCRLANSAGQINWLEMAERATSMAMHKEPDNEEAYRLRALTRVRTLPKKSVEDGSRALQLNTKETQRLELELKRLEQPRFGGPTQYKLDRQRTRRISELETLTAAAFNAGLPDIARDTIHELVALQPRDIGTLQKWLAIERYLENKQGMNAAAQALSKLPLPRAIQVEVDKVLQV